MVTLVGKRLMPQPQPLSPALRELMDIVWDRGEVAVSEVWEILAERRNVARNTVQTMLVRLEDKGWLKHRVIGRTFFYSAVHPREKTQRRMVRDLMQSFFDGSPEDLAAALLDDVSLSKAEADRIRELIDDAERRRRKKR